MERLIAVLFLKSFLICFKKWSKLLIFDTITILQCSWYSLIKNERRCLRQLGCLLCKSANLFLEWNEIMKKISCLRKIVRAIKDFMRLQVLLESFQLMLKEGMRMNLIILNEFLWDHLKKSKKHFLQWGLQNQKQ